MQKIDWHLGEMWNLASFKPDRKLVKRDYCYASELGGSMFTRFLRMNAKEETNPPNDRSKGKFLAGNLWEDAVMKVAKVCGIYKDSQVKIDRSPFSDTLEVHGKCDLIAGAFEKPKALHTLELIKDFIPEDLYWKGTQIIEFLGDKPLVDKLIEIKSCSEYVLDKVLTTKMPIITHGHQANYYRRYLDLPAEVSYISKNDSFMADAIVNPEIYEPLLRQDLEMITYYITKGITPPPDPILSFNNLTAKFEKNIQVEYCPYLALRGYESPYDFRAAVEPKIKRWNTVLSRYVRIEKGELTPTGKEIKLTDQNKDVRKEIESEGYDFNLLLEVKMKNLDDNEEETQ